VVGLRGAKAVKSFADGTPAVTQRPAGKGEAVYFAFLPSLSYLQTAIPKRPTDRGTTDDSMGHLLPTRVDDRVAKLLPPSPAGPVECSEQFIETTVVRAGQGTVIPLINWRPEPAKGLRVSIALDVPAANVALASGRPVRVSRDGNRLTCTLDLDVADALILRK
jgi:hypothetical protein